MLIRCRVTFIFFSISRKIPGEMTVGAFIPKTSVLGSTVGCFNSSTPHQMVAEWDALQVLSQGHGTSQTRNLQIYLKQFRQSTMTDDISFVMVRDDRWLLTRPRTPFMLERCFLLSANADHSTLKRHGTATWTKTAHVKNAVVHIMSVRRTHALEIQRPVKEPSV